VFYINFFASRKIMTENRTKEVFNFLTKCVNGIQEIREDVAVLKTDVSELTDGQKRIEKEVRLNTVAINEIAGEQFQLKIRVDELEKAIVCN